MREIRKVVKYRWIWLLLFLGFYWPVLLCVWYIRSVKSLGYYCYYNCRFLYICKKLKDAKTCKIQIIRKTDQWKEFLFRFHFFHDIYKRMNRGNYSYLKNKRCLFVIVCYEHVWEALFCQVSILEFLCPNIVFISSQENTFNVSGKNLHVYNKKKVYIYNIFLLWSSNDIFKSSRMDDAQSVTSNFITI